MNTPLQFVQITDSANAAGVANFTCYLADMATKSRHPETHLSHRGAWMRAAVLGANDGIVSVSSLILGVAAADASHNSIITAGVAGLVAGALSMGLGEFVSVSSQRDTELADIAREKEELKNEPERERHELELLYQRHGISPELATQIAAELHATDPLKAHLREELGIDQDALARPGQAAWVSMLAFAIGAGLSLITAIASPKSARLGLTLVVSLVSLGLLGAIGARIGGASKRKASLRVFVGGAIAMGITMGIGALVGQAVG